MAAAVCSNLRSAGVNASVSDVCGHTEYALVDLSVDFEYSWIMVECVDKISVCRVQGCWPISQLNIGNRNRTHTLCRLCVSFKPNQAR